ASAPAKPPTIRRFTTRTTISTTSSCRSERRIGLRWSGNNCLPSDVVRLRHIQDRHWSVELSYGGANARGRAIRPRARSRRLAAADRAGAHGSLWIAGRNWAGARDRPRRDAWLAR